MGNRVAPVVLFLVLAVFFAVRQPAYADCRTSFSHHLIQNGGYGIASPDGRIVSACNANIPFIPASIIKIPLTLAAFDILGEDFRFVTEFYLDKQENLYIKGLGDPFLVSEEVEMIVEQLVARGLVKVNGIFVDNSAYALSGQAPGKGESDNPYDVPVIPTAVNFNTVNIRVSGHGMVESAEPQTPVLPLMEELGRGLAPGEHRINICQEGCREEEQTSRYVMELFHALLRNKGVQVAGAMALRKTPPGIAPFYVHRNSRTLREVMYSCLKFSNNFVANQVFLRCGVEKYGLPATWEKARKAVGEALSRLLGKKAAQQIHLAEGSGLSRENRITAAVMLMALEKFRPYADLLPKKDAGSMKSGTLDGVYNYAGYFQDGRRFVVMLNQQANTRDRIVQILKNQ